MRLAIYAIWSLTRDGNAYRGLGCHVRYLRAFLKHVDSLRLFTNLVPDSTAQFSEIIDDRRMEVVSVPWASHVEAWRNAPRLRRLVTENLDDVDAMYVRLFDPAPWLFMPACRRRGIPVLQHIVGNPYEGIRHHSHWSWLGKRARSMLFWCEERLVRMSTGNDLVLANGAPTCAFFQQRGWNCETTVSSTLTEDDFFVRDDTCQASPLTVLFVGFLRPGKRVDLALKAIACLRKDGVPIRLRIVGSPQPASYQGELEQLASSLGIADAVEFVGYVPLGEPLNHMYRTADVFCFPSASEGSPRALLEAAANCLPCVVTDMGSARQVFEGGSTALIVPCGDHLALAHAISRMISDQELRRHCIAGGLAAARSITCDTFIADLVKRLRVELNARRAKS